MNNTKYRKRDRMLTQEYLRRSNSPLIRGSRIGRTTGQEYILYGYDGKNWRPESIVRGNSDPPNFTVLS